MVTWPVVICGHEFYTMSALVNGKGMRSLAALYIAALRYRRKTDGRKSTPSPTVRGFRCMTARDRLRAWDVIFLGLLI